MELKELKKDYGKLAEKYSLPEFKELNEDFDIQKLTEYESETLLRDIRRIVLEKLINYLRFIEVILNTSSGPMFFIMLLKGIKHEDKKLLEEIYAKLGKIELEAFEVDVSYSEKKEAEFIKKILEEGYELKPKLEEISKSLKEAWDREAEKKERSYFG